MTISPISSMESRHARRTCDSNSRLCLGERPGCKKGRLQQKCHGTNAVNIEGLAEIAVSRISARPDGDLDLALTHDGDNPRPIRAGAVGDARIRDVVEMRAVSASLSPISLPSGQHRARTRIRLKDALRHASRLQTSHEDRAEQGNHPLLRTEDARFPTCLAAQGSRNEGDLKAGADGGFNL